MSVLKEKKSTVQGNICNIDYLLKVNTNNRDKNSPRQSYLETPTAWRFAWEVVETEMARTGVGAGIAFLKSNKR